MTKSARRIHRQRVSKRHSAEQRNGVTTTGNRSNVTDETISMWKSFAIANNEKLAKAKDLAKITEDERIQSIREAKARKQQWMRQSNFGRKHFNDNKGDEKPVFHKSEFQRRNYEQHDKDFNDGSKSVKVIRKPASAE